MNRRMFLASVGAAVPVLAGSVVKASEAATGSPLDNAVTPIGIDPHQGVRVPWLEVQGKRFEIHSIVPDEGVWYIPAEDSDQCVLEPFNYSVQGKHVTLQSHGPKFIRTGA